MRSSLRPRVTPVRRSSRLISPDSPPSQPSVPTPLPPASKRSKNAPRSIPLVPAMDQEMTLEPVVSLGNQMDVCSELPREVLNAMEEAEETGIFGEMERGFAVFCVNRNVFVWSVKNEKDVVHVKTEFDVKKCHLIVDSVFSHVSWKDVVSFMCVGEEKISYWSSCKSYPETIDFKLKEKITCSSVGNIMACGTSAGHVLFVSFRAGLKLITHSKPNLLVSLVSKLFTSVPVFKVFTISGIVYSVTKSSISCWEENGIKLYDTPLAQLGFNSFVDVYFSSNLVSFLIVSKNNTFSVRIFKLGSSIALVSKWDELEWSDSSIPLIEFYESMVFLRSDSLIKRVDSDFEIQLSSKVFGAGFTVQNNDISYRLMIAPKYIVLCKNQRHENVHESVRPNSVSELSFNKNDNSPEGLVRLGLYYYSIANYEAASTTIAKLHLESYDNLFGSFAKNLINSAPPVIFQVPLDREQYLTFMEFLYHVQLPQNGLNIWSMFSASTKKEFLSYLELCHAVLSVFEWFQAHLPDADLAITQVTLPTLVNLAKENISSIDTPSQFNKIVSAFFFSAMNSAIVSRNDVLLLSQGYPLESVFFCRILQFSNFFSQLISHVEVTENGAIESVVSTIILLTINQCLVCAVQSCQETRKLYDKFFVVPGFELSSWSLELPLRQWMESALSTSELWLKNPSVFQVSNQQGFSMTFSKHLYSELSSSYTLLASRFLETLRFAMKHNIDLETDFLNRRTKCIVNLRDIYFGNEETLGMVMNPSFKSLMSFVETFGDVDALVELCEKSCPLSLPIVQLTTVEEHASWLDYKVRIDKYLDKFGTVFSNALFDYLINRDSSRLLLLSREFPRLGEPLQNYLHSSESEIALKSKWISDVFMNSFDDASDSLLQIISNKPDKLLTSFQKLCLLASSK